MLSPQRAETNLKPLPSFTRSDGPPRPSEIWHRQRRAQNNMLLAAHDRTCMNEVWVQANALPNQDINWMTMAADGTLGALQKLQPP
jgi:hypothetical protein